jgi:acyl-CoA thioester hydrolase
MSEQEPNRDQTGHPAQAARSGDTGKAAQPREPAASAPSRAAEEAPPAAGPGNTPYLRTFDVRWSDVDANMHMRASVFSDLGDQIRVAFFEEHGYPFTSVREDRVGPVLFTTYTEFYREVLLGEQLTAGLIIESVASRGRKWTIRHDFWKADGTHAASLRVTGSWMNIDTRRLARPHEKLQRVIDQMPREAGAES